MSFLHYIVLGVSFFFNKSMRFFLTFYIFFNDISLVCPANCSGRGKCNFKTYKCECYDSNDKSETCANSSWLGAASGVNNHIIGTLSSSSRNGHDGASSDSNKQYVLQTKKIYCIIFILGLFSWC